MNKRILVTGGSGLVGNYLKKYLPEAIYISSKDYDLTTEKEVKEMFLKYKPNTVIHLAAKVGGIIDNINKPAEYFTENILMNTLLLEYSKRMEVKRFIGILCGISLCVTLYVNSYSHGDIKPSDTLVNSVAMLAFGCLGLTSTEKIFGKKDKTQKPE